MNPLKDEQIKINVTADLLATVSRVAGALRLTPSTLARALVEEYVEAHARHGGKLPWPPQFQYYSDAPIAVSEPKSTDTPLYSRPRRGPAPAVSIAAEKGLLGQKMMTRDRGHSGG